MFQYRLAADNNRQIPEDVDPTLDDTVQYIEWLMTWYCRKPSIFIANVIVSRLEALRLGDPGDEPPAPEWQCRRLQRHWEYLAERCRARVRA